MGRHSVLVVTQLLWQIKVKAIAHRQLTPVLVVLCLVAIAWLVALISGMGRDVHWHAPLSVSSLPAAPHAVAEVVVPPLDAMRVAWERPLFEPTRRMMSLPVSTAEVPLVKLTGLVLTGTVLAGTVQVALIRDASGKELRIPVGGSYQGWMLGSLESRRAVFRNGRATVEVIFPVGGVEAPNVIGAEGEVTSQPVDFPPEAPMMTLETVGHASASIPLGDTTIRQARLESLKDMVARRRAESSANTEGH